MKRDTTLIDFAVRHARPHAHGRGGTGGAGARRAVGADLGLSARRMLNCFTKGVADRRRHLTQLARVLPRPEQLFAAARQRLDIAGDKLGAGLRHNVCAVMHRSRFHKGASACCGHGCCKNRIALGRERASGRWLPAPSGLERADIAKAPSIWKAWTRVAGKHSPTNRCWSAALPWCAAKTARSAVAAKPPSKPAKP